MRASEWSGDDLVDALVAPVEPSFADGVVVLTDPPTGSCGDVATAARRRSLVPCVVVAGPGCAVGPDLLDLADVVADSDDDLAALLDGVAAAPVAARAATSLLRATPGLSVEDGLLMESAVFSALQAGPEHRSWLRRRGPGRDGADGRPRVRVERHDDEVAIWLCRPEAANALDAQMRDELLDVLAVVEADPALRAVVRGDGPVFCSGGDLAEFGSAADPATAHLLRTRRSIAAVLARVASRVTVMVQGTAAGSGLELAAFAGRVVARPDAGFVLPELALGLVPGAGGTVSLVRRIGRHRTAWMLLTGRRVDATTARSWGLVDVIELF